MHSLPFIADTNWTVGGNVNGQASYPPQNIFTCYNGMNHYVCYSTITPQCRMLTNDIGSCVGCTLPVASYRPHFYCYNDVTYSNTFYYGFGDIVYVYDVISM